MYILFPSLDDLRGQFAKILEHFSPNNLDSEPTPNNLTNVIHVGLRIEAASKANDDNIVAYIKENLIMDNGNINALLEKGKPTSVTYFN